jgi:hypothetical protein
MDGGDENSEHEGILRLLPTHDVGTDASGRPAVIRRRPGRPRKVELRPTATDLSYHAEVAAARQAFIDDDPLVTALENNEDVRTVLRLLLSSITREAAALEFSRREVEKRGRDAAQISSRRVDALKKAAEIELKLRELDAETWNLSSERFQRLFAFWVEKLTAVAAETLPAEARDLLFNKLSTAMANWEVEASSRIQ